jgi:hypothetical protein
VATTKKLKISAKYRRAIVKKQINSLRVWNEGIIFRNPNNVKWFWLAMAGRSKNCQQFSPLKLGTHQRDRPTNRKLRA